MGMLDGLIGAGVSAASRIPGALPSQVGPSTYWFRAFDGDKEVFSVRLRLPPSSLRFIQPLRSQVRQDFNGGISVLEGGPGIGRWSLSGQHGIGKLDDKTLAKHGGDTAGLQAMKALHAFFTRVEAEGLARRVKGGTSYRVEFAISGGGPSELRYAKWRIRAESLPTWERSNTNPLNWEWSFSFLVLESLSDIKPEKARTPDAPGALSALDKALGKLGLKPWNPNKGLLANLQEMKRNGDRIREGIAVGMRQVTTTVRGLTGAARGLAEVSNAILRDTRNSVHDVRTGALGDVRGVRDAAIAGRRLAGAVWREARGKRDEK